MVIERALEKLKESQAAHGTATVDRVSGGRGSDTQRQPARTASAVPAGPPPEVAQLKSDMDAAIKNRILLPGSLLAQEGHVSAAYRMIRARLRNLISQNNWSTLAVTSPEAGEGKSVTALNLALSFSRDTGRPIFLIDLDMRNPTICKYLGVRPPHTLIEYFSGGCPVQKVFFSVGTENLVVAGNTEPTDLASELLATDHLDQLLAYIKAVVPNALILIDLPPILVTDEALMVAPRVDATTLVVADGQTRRDSLLRARQLLADFPFAGVILNKSSESPGNVGYYYSYGRREE
jgi:protein-tyrosine kinase